MQKDRKEKDEPEVVKQAPVDDDEEETLAEYDSADTIVMTDTDFSDSIGEDDDSMELNVDELVAKAEAEQRIDLARKKEIRRRLEELAEKKAFDDTYAIDFDND